MVSEDKIKRKVSMNLREMSALASTVLVIVGTAWYIFHAVTGDKVKPVLASWIVIAGTMSLSFATYWTTPNHNLVSNACNAISILSSASILVTAIWLNTRKGVGLSFSSFQKLSLVLSFAIVVIWAVLVWGFKGTGLIPNILTQVLMLIGYFVTAQKLWHAEKNTEPLFTWWCIALASFIAFFTGVVSHDGLVILYASRASFGTVGLLCLMYRAEFIARLGVQKPQS